MLKLNFDGITDFQKDLLIEALCRIVEASGILTEGAKLTGPGLLVAAGDIEDALRNREN